MEENFEVVFHHGGKFINERKLIYEGESTTYSFDPYVWSYFLVVSVVKGLSYDGFKELFYSIGGCSVLENRLEPLLDDVGAMQMITLARLNGQVHLFVVHKVSEPEVIHMLEYVPENTVEEQGEGMAKGEHEDEGRGMVEGECEEEGVGLVEGDREEEVGGMVEGECEEEGGVTVEVECEEEGEGNVEGECEDQGEVAANEVDKITKNVVLDEERVQADDVVEGHIETEDVGDVSSWTSSHKDDDGNDDVNYECMEGLVDVNVECNLEEDVGDEVADWFGNVQVDVQSDDSDLDDGINSDNVRGLSDDEWKYDELDSGAESDGQDDEDEGYRKFVTFSMPKSMVDYKWDVGTYFTDKQDFVDAIKTYLVQNGRNIKYLKNDKKRCRLKCMGAKGQCPWMAYCAYMEAIHMWQFRTIVDNHICSRGNKLRLLNAKWLSKRLEKTVRENPQVKGVEIREKISRKWNVGVSRCMAYRAKAIASDHVDGSFKDQYRKIYDYANELLARNPGSTVKVKVEETVDGHIFKRFYRCLKACEDSFVSCRPIIRLDGAFLKGKYGGEMLTVVGRDANDQMLPLADAVVEVENKETWRWFLELLVEDHGGIEVASSFTFMSNQQKGLLQVVQEVVPRVDQRFCLLKIPPRHWSRSRFTSKSQCDTLVNNMSEAFNSVMLHTRSKPIVSMLEEIRLYLIKRWATNRTKIQSLFGEICPKIKTRLNKESQLTKYWIPCWSANKIFEVRHVSQASDKFTVNLDEKLCSCRKWEIIGIPCCHSLAAMKFLNVDAEDFIPCCFRKSTYEEIYSSIIYLINGNNMWEITTYVDVLPPPKRILSGRPKKKRRLEQ